MFNKLSFFSSCKHHKLLLKRKIGLKFLLFRNFNYETRGDDPIKLLFLHFFFFGVKLGHFTINNFFLHITKMQAYQQKTEKFFVSEENKFGRIDSRTKKNLKIWPLRRKILPTHILMHFFISNCSSGFGFINQMLICISRCVKRSWSNWAWKRSIPKIRKSRSKVKVPVSLSANKFVFNYSSF